jgi:hypothetical protein
MCISLSHPPLLSRSAGWFFYCACIGVIDRRIKCSPAARPAVRIWNRPSAGPLPLMYGGAPCRKSFEPGAPCAGTNGGGMSGIRRPPGGGTQMDELALDQQTCGLR